MNINDFRNYLFAQKYSTSTVMEHMANIKRLQQWQQDNDLRSDTLNYNELLSYISYLQSRKIKPQSINIRLQSISHYYEYLKEYGYITTNTARKVRVKGTARTVVKNVFSFEELQVLYQEYVKMKKEKKPEDRSEAQRHYSCYKHITLLGLVVFQGLSTHELKHLQIKDIDMNKGVIHLPGAKRINARILKLETLQIVPLSIYLNLLNATEERLFTETPVGIAFGILRELQGLNTSIYSLNQLRSSLIIHWIKQYGKRKTQYLAGHRYISSTEKYELQNIDVLTDLLKKHHPFG